MGIKALVVDLDGTLWSHRDISRTRPPFRRVSDGVVVDSTGQEVRLNPCVEEALRAAREAGLRLAVASWNDPEPAVEALKALGVYGYFDLLVIEPHPGKDRMLEKILRELRLSPGEVVFVDDTEYMVELVREAHPGILSLRMGVDVRDFCELLRKLNIFTTQGFRSRGEG
ncbi:magnesium-dependent phosphatase-1 [Thermofilum pendens]|uniref:Magnesium-dependent phosphatase-1 n=1 Tax=Thermofilum pendens (strain DSM 2475 / Hrk 5) TaxID=368408 RepID=A1S0T4_THEPD|nr:magnesium-dependent phosphatase-1 [Thermofilum pendens]ABL79064.1 magnesium-dependent phosphatase-1 [Thermofilum pendens Hrk 5]